MTKLLFQKTDLFPRAKKFDTFFSEALPWEGNEKKPVQTNGYFSTSGYCIVRDMRSDEYTPALWLQPSERLLERLKNELIPIANDTKHFEIIIYKDNTARLIISYGIIIGSRWIAVVDADSLPEWLRKPKTPKGQNADASSDAVRS